MRLGIGQFSDASSEYLNFARQMGVEDVLLNTARLPSVDGTWSLKALVKLRLSIEQHGLKLSALENVPTEFYDQIMLGGPEREKQIERMISTIRNMARAGIPRFGYNWMPSHVWRTHNVTLRGGAVATAFSLSKSESYPNTDGRTYDEQEMWRNLEEWIRIVTPVAEEEGILLGIHPCDPPVESLGGVPQLFRSFESYKRLIEIVDSPSNSIEFCQGTFAEMEDGAGDGIYEMIDYFSSRRRILYVHFRNVSGTVPDFYEEFINTGYVDMRKAMKIYARNGYDSFFIPDHVPLGLGDSPWGHRGRAFAAGYIQALIEEATGNHSQ